MSSPVTVWRHHKNIKNYLGQTGKIVIWTKVYIAPAGFEHEAPYPVAIVKFKDGTSIPLQVVEYEEKHLKPNQKIITVVRKLGKVKIDEVIEYGIKAKPI
ncbi:MAG: OB-fold domain-containing protein [Candidatus Daviesbacteria bacterium]|nr:OB-fold domain-containing protein [Candidatus Daviesbacteria bacterium]